MRACEGQLEELPAVVELSVAVVCCCRYDSTSLHVHLDASQPGVYSSLYDMEFQAMWVLLLMLTSVLVK